MVDEVDISNELSNFNLQKTIDVISAKKADYKKYTNCLYCNELLLDKEGNPKPRKFCNNECADAYEIENNN